jgi:DTW domain-containing protein YfiP
MLPLSRNRKTLDPCGTCFLHKKLCICEFIPRLKLKTRLSLVIHAKELKRTTNTGRLAIAALENSAMFVRGAESGALDMTPTLGDAYRSLVFFPADDALDLTEEFVHSDPRPIHLIVPDGNWRQAAKVHSRQPELRDLPRVMIKAHNTSKFHLRAESTPEGMATLQAIAYALGVIEGEDVKTQLLELYERKLRGTLIGRGVLKPEA